MVVIQLNIINLEWLLKIVFCRAKAGLRNGEMRVAEEIV